MHTKLTHNARAELADAIRGRHRRRAMLTGEPSLRRPSATSDGRLHDVLSAGRNREESERRSNLSREASGNKIT